MTGQLIQFAYLLGAVLLALVAPEFIRLALGAKWLPMLTAFRLMLVFTLLVVPSVMAIRLFDDGRRQFLWILTVGTVAVIIGSALSYLLDLPTGAAIVCTFGLVLGVQILCEGAARR